MPLHLTKVAFGCTSSEMLVDRMRERAAGGDAAWLETRYRPTRHTELIGGSLYWIIKHRLVARQTILGFDEAEGGRWRILLSATVVPVRGKAKRAHQGWRYLTEEARPADLDGDDADLSALPPRLVSELSALLLI